MKKPIFVLVLSVFYNLVSAQKPNIVFIFSDDLSFRDLSAYGQTNYKTPNLDALVAHSTRFTQAYAAAPECAPSRGCMLTGLQVGRSPIRINSSARGFEELPATALTFPKMLQQNGYKTAVIGKWGLGYPNSIGDPRKQGFDYHFGYYDHYEAHSFFPLNLYRNGKKVDYPTNNAFNLEVLYDKERAPKSFDYEGMYDADGKLKYINENKGVYAVDEFDREALEYISANKNNPFFLFYTTNLPHGPQIVDDLRDLKDRKDMDLRSREWGAMVRRLDISVGKLIQKLKDEGVYENTMILFASDNGYAMHNPGKDSNGMPRWEDDKWLQNKGPFNGGKFTVREAGMRIPLFIRMPNQSQAKTMSQPVWLIDLFPTFADFIKASAPENIDGFSLLPLLTGQVSKIPTERPFYFFKNNEQSVRMGAWFGYREHPNKPLQLYLLEEDQTCERNLAAFYPDVVTKIEDYLKTAHEPHPWYWNPGETQEDFQRKQKLAIETKQKIEALRPNNMKLMPWEKSAK
ncbi:sulfatase-like hydrolase/transferase [Arundinibacter roseus]|nr:sulfatase-like hydrolase/transferase [Arundinibacter roseus]